ncbi:MAG: hypothetical protein JXJ04_24350 [Spirochaetales bacterium]|nr:hypothetical protein [Spirochaetales bacterium]
MKKEYMLAIFLFIVAGQILLADVTAISIAGGSISTEDSNTIEMVYEEINIELYKAVVRYNIHFTFYNHGATENIQLGFPKWGTNDPVYGIFGFDEWVNYNFISFSINGKEKPFKRIDIEIPEPSNDEVSLIPQINAWYVYNHEFPEKEEVNIEVTYETIYGLGGRSSIAEYLIGTGKTWYKSIKTLKISITPKEDLYFNYLAIDCAPYFSLNEIKPNYFEIVLNDIEPDINDVISIHFYDDPETSFAFNYSGVIGFYKQLDKNATILLTKEQLIYYQSLFKAMAGFEEELEKHKNFFEEWEIPIDKKLKDNDTWKYNMNLIDELIQMKEGIDKYLIPIKKIEASSYIDYKNMYHPSKIFDNDINTGWLENIKGSGIGEYITITFKNEITFDEIRFAPGYFDKKWWNVNNRVKKIKMTINKENYFLDFKDKREIQTKSFNKKITCDKICFSLEEVYKSNKDDDTGISEIQFYYNGNMIYLEFKGII